MVDADDPVGDPTEGEQEIGGDPYRCTTTPYSITRTPDRIVTLNPDVEILWVGSLLQGKGHLGGIGRSGELPIRQRAPMNLSIDLLTADNARTVQNPSLATVTSAVGDLIQAAQDAGHTAGSNIFYTKETTHSLTQAALAMGLSASYMGATIKATLSTDISDETRTVTAYFVQRMFNVSMELPQTSGAVFSDAFTTDLLQQQIDRGRIGPDNLPVYISASRTDAFSCSRSRRRRRWSTSMRRWKRCTTAASSAAVSTAHLQRCWSRRRSRSSPWAATPTRRCHSFATTTSDAYFAQDAPLTTARPISYTVRNLADNSIASVGRDHQLQPAAVRPGRAAGDRRHVHDQVHQGQGPRSAVHRPGRFHPTTPWTSSCSGRCTSRPSPTAWSRYRRTPQWAIRSALLREGDTFVLPANSATNRAIHIDGRDYIRLWGRDSRLGSPSAADKLPFSRDFQYPAKPISEGEGYVDAKDSSGNTVRVYFTVQKTGELDD